MRQSVVRDTPSCFAAAVALPSWRESTRRTCSRVTSSSERASGSRACAPAGPLARAFDGVLQLADVARPLVAGQEHLGLRREAERSAARPAAGAVQEVRRQEPHVAAALAQRRHLDLDDVQPVVEVAPEAALGNQRLEVAVRGRHDAHVHEPRRVLAEPAHLVVLERAQEPDLRGERHVADLVQEQRALVRLLHEPRAVRRGARERSPREAEEFALDERLGERSHVHGHERSLRALGEHVERAGDQLLPRSALAQDEHGAVRRRHACDQLQEPLHARAGPDDGRERHFARCPCGAPGRARGHRARARRVQVLSGHGGAGRPRKRCVTVSR